MFDYLYSNQRITKMGSPGIGELVRQRCIISVIKRKQYFNIRAAVDGLNMIYATCNSLYINHIEAVLVKTLSMIEKGIFPVWVFDGPPPRLKGDTLMVRSTREKSKKSYVSIKAQEIKEIISLLEAMGIPYIIAPGEAEAQCAALNLMGLVQIVITNDIDAILFGCKTMVKYNGTDISGIDTTSVLNSLKLTQLQLIQLSCIVGNDYCRGIIGLKYSDAYSFFKESKCDINNFLEKIRLNEKYTIPENFTTRFSEAVNCFLHLHVLNVSQSDIQWKTPNYKKIIEVLNVHTQMTYHQVLSIIIKYKLMFDTYTEHKEFLTFDQIRQLHPNIVVPKKIVIQDKNHNKSIPENPSIIKKENLKIPPGFVYKPKNVIEKKESTKDTKGKDKKIESSKSEPTKQPKNKKTKNIVRDEWNGGMDVDSFGW